MSKTKMTVREKIEESRKERVQEVIKDMEAHRFSPMVHEEYDRVLEDYILHPSAERKGLILKLIRIEKNFLYDY
jgi:hypothetical protein